MSRITVEIEVTDKQHLDDLVRIIESAAPYMGDNVTVKSHYGDSNWPASVALPGTVSHGTLRRESLTLTFMQVLEDVNRDEFIRLITWFDQQPGDSEDHDEFLEKLTRALEESAPEGYYFGAIEGDGSDFGFWELGCEICGTTTRNDEGELIDHTEDECFK